MGRTGQEAGRPNHTASARSTMSNCLLAKQPPQQRPAPLARGCHACPPDMLSAHGLQAGRSGAHVSNLMSWRWRNTSAQYSFALPLQPDITSALRRAPVFQHDEQGQDACENRRSPVVDPEGARPHGGGKSDDDERPDDGRRHHDDDIRAACFISHGLHPLPVTPAFTGTRENGASRRRPAARNNFSRMPGSAGRTAGVPASR